jgi:uncharacterized protein (DUF4415 family)
MRKENITNAVVTTDGRVMLAQPDGSFRPMEGKTDWEWVRDMADEEVESVAEQDAGSLPESIWDQAQPVSPLAIEKVSVPFDADVVEWFRRQGRGYQYRMNAVLRAYIKARERQT